MKLHALTATRSESHFFMLAAWVVTLCLFTAGHAWASPTYIDNTSPTFSVTGTWSTVTDSESYGGNHRASGVGAVTATWALPATLPSGLYAVWANWPTSTSNGTSVTFNIHHATAITSKTVNQQLLDTALLFGNNSAASGNFLGVYCLDPALGNKIMLSHTAAVGNLAMADAIKLVPFFEATGGNLDISDAPLASQIPQATPNLLFVLDDSGSMDWEFLTTESDGTFNNYYYVFDNPGDNLYSGILPSTSRGLYKSQWSGYNKLYYNPKQAYLPWVNQANANPNTPRSHPTSTVDTQTFNLDNVYRSINSGVVGEVILDNVVAGGYTYVDGSHFSPGQVGTDGSPYGGNYYYSTGVAGSWARWTTPAPLPAGTYEVYARWPNAGSSTNRDRLAQYEVFDGGVKLGATAVLSQRYNANTWMSLGSKTFTGGIASVKLTRSGSQTRTLADAVRFLPTGAGSMINIINAHYYTWNDLDSDGTRDAGEDIYLVNLTNPIAYYRFNDLDSDDNVENGELISVAAASVPATVRTYAVPTAADAYTVERQNFANWYSFYRRRELAATAAISRVISGLSEIRVGIYSINNRIIQPVQDVHVGASDSTTALLNTLYALRLQANGTPLRTGLNYAGRYFDKDDSLVSGTIAGYASPIASQANGGACQQNFTILMTDGYYNDPSPPSPGNVDGNNGAPFADGYSNTLADVAMLYYENDLADTVENRIAAPSTYDNATWQHMVTYTVALGVVGTLNPDDYPASNNFKNTSGQYPVWPDPATSSQRKIDDMWHAAVNGRGDFVSASNPQELVDGLLAMVGGISNRVGSEASLALNSEGLSGDLTTETRLYETTYLPTDWSGNVMAYSIDPVTKRVGTSVWSARQNLKTLLDSGSGTGYTNRAIATFNGAAGIPFRWASLSAEQKSALNNEEIRLNYLRGDSSQEVQYGGALRNRIWRLGDIVNSMAVFEENTTTTTSDDMLYVGANDGMLHAFDANTGDEVFAYVPNLVFNNLVSLTQPTYTHKFFVNGSPTVKTVKGTSYLLGGLLKGGKGYYCLDVTPAKITAIKSAASAADKETLLAAMVKWEYSGASCSVPDLDLGYGYSRPYLRKTNNRSVNSGQPIEGYMVFFGNGYSSPDGSAVLYALNPLTGEVVRKIDTQSGPDNGLSSVTLVDVNGDLREDYAYAGDLKGNLWKFDLTSDNPANWSVAYQNGVMPEPVFRTPSPGQPITSEVDVMYAPAPKMYVSSGHGVSTKNPGYMVIFGTGRYLGLSDLSDTSQQSVYGIWDYGDDGDGAEYLGRFHSPSTGRLSNQPIGYTLARQTVVYSGAELIAKFTAAPTGVSVPGEVIFTDDSFGTISTRSWDFGDGGTSTATNPSHIYTASGTYTVTLTVTRTAPLPVLSSASTSTVTVIHDYLVSIATDLNDNPALSAGEEVLAYFEGAVTGGASGATATFSNLSKGALDGATYLWDFGDGSTSTASNPSHTYTAEGDFTVSLTVTTPTATSDTRTNSNYISVSRPWIINVTQPSELAADYYSAFRVMSDTMKECPSTAVWGTDAWVTDQNKCKWLASEGCIAPYTATSDTCVVHPYYYCTGTDLVAGQNKDPGPCPDDPETDITELIPSELPVYLGWYFDLPDVGERIAVDPAILSGNVEIISHVPQATMCSAEGYSWILAMDAATGGPPDDVVWDINRDQKVSADDYKIINGKKVPVTGVKFDRRVFRPGRVKDSDSGTSLLYFETGGGSEAVPGGGDVGTGGGAAPLVGRLPRTGVVVWQEMP